MHVFDIFVCELEANNKAQELLVHFACDSFEDVRFYWSSLYNTIPKLILVDPWFVFFFFLLPYKPILVYLSLFGLD